MTSRKCISCDGDWDDPAHRRQMQAEIGNCWRGNPGQLTPHRQWTRENLPQGKERFVVCGDDGFARTWTTANPVGIVTPFEWKTYGADIDFPTSLAFRALASGSVNPSVVVRLEGGNTPSPLKHYPEPCAACGLPERPQVADIIRVNDTEVSAGDVRAVLLKLTSWSQ